MRPIPPALVLSIFTALALALRLIGLNEQLWFDEVGTANRSIRTPLADLLTNYTSDNQHTLHSLMAKWTAGVFGEHPWTLRLPALVLGTLSVPALYVVGRNITSRTEALSAALLLAVSSVHVAFSQNARGYTALLLATLVSTGCFLVGLRQPRWRTWIVYALTVALGAYVHLTMAFVAIGHAVALLVVAGSGVSPARGTLWRAGAGLALAMVLTLAMYAPALPEVLSFYLGQRERTGSEWLKPDYAAAETMRGLLSAYGMACLVAVVLLAGLGLWIYLRQKPIVAMIIVLPGLFALLALTVEHHNVRPRFFFYGWGFTLMLVPRGAATLSAWLSRAWHPHLREAIRSGLYAACIGAIVLASLAALGPVYRTPKQDFVGAMRFVESARRPGEPVVVVDLQPFLRYYGVGWTQLTSEDKLDEILARGRRTWLVHSFREEPIESTELARRVMPRFRHVRTFPAEIRGLEIVVMVSEPAPRDTMPQRPPSDRPAQAPRPAGPF